jgi:tRNA G18 (ribose-2'-O)-methylase SpoU
VPSVSITRRNSTFQVLSALKGNRAKRNELREVFVEGIAAIKSAVASGRTPRRLIYQDGVPLSGWARALLASSGDAQMICLDRGLFHELADKDEPSELLATFAMERLSLSDREIRDESLVVMVDRPGNRGNLGSIIRSANAFGVDLLVTLGHGVDLYDPAVIRASMGGIFRTPVCHEESTRALEDWIAWTKAAHPGMAVVGTDSRAHAALSDVSPVGRPLLVLIGNEASGLSVRLKEMVDTMVRIPMRGTVDSLNVACAASIVIYELSNAEVERPAARAPAARAASFHRKQPTR